MDRPRYQNPDPLEHWVRVKAWHRRHYDCGGHYCRHDNGKPCPLPPPIPYFTHCPDYDANQLRMVDCGGCEECKPGHHCHLNGKRDNCMSAEPLPDNAIFSWADYELITMVSLHGDLEEL